MERAHGLFKRGVRLATTDRNALELHQKLIDVFGLSMRVADHEVDSVLDIFELVVGPSYEHRRTDADARLNAGGKSDWPLLAAALALEGEIWSDDRDFFGIGLPVWSTPNVHLVQAD